MSKQKRIMRRLAIAIFFWQWFGGFASVYAATDTNTLEVKITVISTCDIHTGSKLAVDFGSQKSTATDIKATGSLTVNCTKGTPYYIGLDDGENAADGHRNMKGGQSGSALLGYNLYQDASLQTAWGGTDGVDTLHKTGTGTDEIVSVYGKVITTAGNPTLTAGDYTDAVVATVTY